MEQLIRNPVNRNSIFGWLTVKYFLKKLNWTSEISGFFFFFSIFQPLDFHLLPLTFFNLGYKIIVSNFKSFCMSQDWKYSSRWSIPLMHDLVKSPWCYAYQVWDSSRDFCFLSFKFSINLQIFYHLIILQKT